MNLVVVSHCEDDYRTANKRRTCMQQTSRHCHSLVVCLSCDLLNVGTKLVNVYCTNMAATSQQMQIVFNSR